METNIFNAPFEFDSLDSPQDSLRLLRLLRAPGGQLECEIFQGSLTDDNVAYEALSYTWGSGELVERIKVNGKLLWITENLHIALQYLRLCDEDRVLWADAICINQQNVQEREQQVQQMPRIYSKAYRVIIWLGKPTSDAAMCMYILGQLEKQNQQLDTTGCMLNDDRWYASWFKVQEGDVHRNALLMTQCRNGLYWLLRRSWFERIWIIQEVVNAQAAVIACGEFSVSTHIFVLALSRLGSPKDFKFQPILDIMPGLSRKSSWLNEQRDLKSLLFKFKTAKATDERDKVYALHGISVPDGIDNLFAIDYTKSVESLISGLANHIVKQTNTPLHEVLNFLSTFETLDTLCLVRQAYDEAAPNLEILSLDSERGEVSSSAKEDETILPGVMPVRRDTVRFFCERQSDRLEQGTASCHSQFNDLLRIESEIWKHLRLINWKISKQNVRILVLKRAGLALIEACSSGHDHIARLLIDQGVDVFRHTRYRARYRSPLEAASANSQLHIVKMLLQRGVCRSGWQSVKASALRVASDEKVIKSLINNGANVDCMGKYGETLLSKALARGRKKAVKALLESGASVDNKDEKEQTAFYKASQNGYKCSVMLLPPGADISIYRSRGEAHETLLEAALWGGHEEFARTLLAQGASIGSRGIFNATLRRDRPQIFKLLLENGIDINNTNGSIEKRTALHHAACHGRAGPAKLLLLNGADIETKDAQGNTALHLAAMNGQVEVIYSLLKNGANTRAKDNEGKTAIDYAILNDHTRTARMLHDGRDYNHKERR